MVAPGSVSESRLSQVAAAARLAGNAARPSAAAKHGSNLHFDRRNFDRRNKERFGLNFRILVIDLRTLIGACSASAATCSHYSELQSDVGEGASDVKKR
jgi:hypothetical protein